MGRHADKLRKVRLNAPVSTEDIAGLELGTVVYLDGTVFTGREGVYKRAIDDGEPLPIDPHRVSNVNFHCSPAAADNGDGTYRVGAVTATASFRFAKWLDRWFEQTGTRVIIGKGGMNPTVYRDVFVKHGAIYLTTVGYGTGALLGRGIKNIRAAHWIEELGIAQAMWVFDVENFGPFLVESNIKGKSLFEQTNAEIGAKIDALYEGTTPPALRRYGETDDRSDEVV